jgi:glutamyl-tRNA reductase
VLDRLLVHPARHSYNIVSYSRSAERAQKLQDQFGVRTILGSLDDVEKIEEAAATADVVFHTANSADHLPSAQAILRGLKKKHADTGKTPLYIHTVRCLFQVVSCCWYS